MKLNLVAKILEKEHSERIQRKIQHKRRPNGKNAENKKEKKKQFSRKIFFRLEEISCENEQEDSAKNPYEKGIDKKRVSRGNKKPLEQYDVDEIHIWGKKYEIGDIKTEIFHVLLTLLIDFKWFTFETEPNVFWKFDSPKEFHPVLLW